MRGALRSLGGAGVIAVLVLSMSLPAGAEPGVSGPHYLPANVGGNVSSALPYAAVTCVDAGDCTAVGPEYASEAGSATIVAESSGVWGSAVGVTLPANAESTASGGYSDLDSVTCWSLGNCVATGGYAVSTNVDGFDLPIPQPMVVDETDGVWGAAQEVVLPTTSNIEGGELYAASCDSSGDCTAVGYYISINIVSDASTAYAMVTTQAEGTTTWTPVSNLPIPSSISLVISTTVSCSTATTCQANEIALSTDEGSETAYFLTETDGTWAPPVAVPKLGADRFAYRAMSCPTPGNCVASGFGSTSAAGLLDDAVYSEFPAVDTETNGTWATPHVLSLPFLSPATKDDALLSISCQSVTTCVAVGGALESPSNLLEIPLIASEVDGVWSATYDESHFAVGSSPAMVAQMSSVDCVSATSCLVVGNVATGNVTTSGADAGFWSTVTPLEVVGVPGKPAGVKVTPGTVVTKVTFSPPTTDGGSRITLFTVTAKAAREKTRTCTTSGLSCTFKGAIKGRTYTVTVTARNAKGVSASSPARTFIAR